MRWLSLGERLKFKSEDLNSIPGSHSFGSWEQIPEMYSLTSSVSWFVCSHPYFLPQISQEIQILMRGLPLRITKPQISIAMANLTWLVSSQVPSIGDRSYALEWKVSNTTRAFLYPAVSRFPRGSDRIKSKSFSRLKPICVCIYLFIYCSPSNLVTPAWASLCLPCPHSSSGS